MRSSWSLQTSIWSTDISLQNRNSSLKTAFCNSFLQVCCSAPQSQSLSLCYIDKESRSKGEWADRSCCYKWRSIVNWKIARNWSCCKHAYFLTNSPRTGYTVLQSWPHKSPVLSDVSNGRALKSCMPVSMILSNPLNPYSHAGGWMSTSVTGDIT